MSNYNIKLTPDFIVPFSEGDLDSSILNGKSLQRTFNMYEVDNANNRKMISVKDGDTFNNTTFQNSSGTGTFEAGLTLLASQILTSDGEHDANGFYGVGAILEITPDQALVLNSYGYPSLYFAAVWGDGSYDVNSYLNIFAIDGLNLGETFTDVAVIIPVNEAAEAYCEANNPRWNMPVVTTNFMGGYNGPGVVETAYSDPHMVYRLYKQVIAQHEIDFSGKTAQEKADAVKAVLEGLSDDHPLVANLRKRN